MCVPPTHARTVHVREDQVGNWAWWTYCLDQGRRAPGIGRKIDQCVARVPASISRSNCSIRPIQFKAERLNCSLGRCESGELASCLHRFEELKELSEDASQDLGVLN